MTEEQLHIPIPHYPPFQLRSSLIDKDPVIWAHLLEGYIELCQLLLSGNVNLNIKSQQHLQLFLKVFLAETSQESTRIFSLGSVNPDIKKNTLILRAYVFQLIRDYGFVKLKLPKECLWHFVIVYIEKNASVVRGLLNGSLKSKFNDNKKSGKISQIPPLRRYFIEMLRDGRVTAEDLKYLSMLLGQHTSAARVQTVLVTDAGSVQPRIKSKNRTPSNSLNALQFAEMFVNEEWIEHLELLYAGSKSIHAEIIRNLMVISVLSLSTTKVASLVATLGIHGTGTMMVAPLFSSLIISEAYKNLCPGLEERLPFLRNINLSGIETANDEDIAMLQDMFPDIVTESASTLLLQNNNDLDKVINLLLENPSIVNEVNESSTKPPAKSSNPTTHEIEKGIERFSLKKNETTEVLTKLSSQALDESRKRTLTHALRLLYESDEDERDDTYDELNDEGSNKITTKITHLSDDAELEDIKSSERSEHDKISLILFGYLKKESEVVFQKSSRKSKTRNEMRSQSGWFDEQIEGWYRMLQQSPKRYRLLEEQYATENSNKAIAISLAQKEMERDDTPPPDQTVNSRRALAKKGKNKASVGNHNRKRGHDKKTKATLTGMQ